MAYTIEISKVEFVTEDNLTLRGLLYKPVSEVPLPGIVMAHGYGALKEMHLPKFASLFSENGFNVLLYDHRCFGDSDGSPRQEINPYTQITDYQHAITYLMNQTFVDPNRIGVWGSSYSGGHVLVLGARDKRVKCIVSQVPTISGSQAALRRMSPEATKELQATFNADRWARMQQKEPSIKKIVRENDNDLAIYNTPDAIEWYLESGKLSDNWVNYVTLRSIEFSRSYEPGNYIHMIAPIPLLMLVATEDTTTPTDLALKAFNQALEPKKLVLEQGHHFSPYTEKFETYSSHALEWFKQHL